MESKEKEIHELKELMDQSKQEIKDQFQAYESKLADFIRDTQSRLNQEETSRSNDKMVTDKMREILDRVGPDWFQEVFGPKAHRLTPKALEKAKEFLKILTSQMDAESRQRDLELQKQRKVLIDSMATNTST